MKPNLKQVFQNTYSGIWQLVCIKQTSSGKYYVKAKTRFSRGFEQTNSFDGYFSEKYLSFLCKEYFGRKIHNMKAFTY